MKPATTFLLVLTAMLAAYAGRHYWLKAHGQRTSSEQSAAARPLDAARFTATVETTHYAIASTAASSQTVLVSNAVESLHGAYTTFFGDSLKIDVDRPKLKLVLYKDRQEFKAHNRSSPWAEAFYLAPLCHAYYGDGANPYHWMLHEATHQLNHEVAKLPRVTWIEEGLASYFGASRIQDQTLEPGTVDIGAYPIWWLPSVALSGNLQEDIRRGRIISLRALINSGRSDIGKNVNLHYIGYWSLTHFLFHYDNGRYASRYRKLMASGGSLEEFERLLGPIERIEGQWYGYLQQRINDVAGPATDTEPVFIDP